VLKAVILDFAGCDARRGKVFGVERYDPQRYEVLLGYCEMACEANHPQDSDATSYRVNSHLGCELNIESA
jgi:hypothetical protein